MNIRIFLSLAVATFVLSPAESASAAAAPWPQDDLFKRSDVIAIVDIYGREFPKSSGTAIINGPSVFEGQEWPISLILYETGVGETLYGRISKQPLIVQYDGAGDRNPLDNGRYLLFLKSEGFLFSTLEAIEIKKDRVVWYRTPTSDNPKIFEEMSLTDAVRDIARLIEKYKKES